MSKKPRINADWGGLRIQLTKLRQLAYARKVYHSSRWQSADLRPKRTELWCLIRYWSAGTGVDPGTWLAPWICLKRNEIERILLVRPAVEAGEKNWAGF